MFVQAAVARHVGRTLVVEPLELDEPRADEVLVRLVASGVGHPDIAAIATGMIMPTPFVPGGEGAGIVERVGCDVRGVASGDAVILTAASCGRCPACASGTFDLCVSRADLNESGRRSDGSAPFLGNGAPINGFFQGQSSFSTHVLCDRSCVIKVANDAALEVLACLGGSLWATASIILDAAAGLDHVGSIVVTGADAEGLIATMVAHALGLPTIVVADPRESRRSLATTLGATLVVHTDDDLASVVKSLTGAGAHLAFDTTGHEGAIEACRDSLAPTGRLCRAGKSMVSTPQTTIETLTLWHAEGRFPLEKLATFYPFEHVDDALADLETGAVVKPILRFSIGSFGGLDRADIEGAETAAPEPDAPDQDTPVQEPTIHDPRASQCFDLIVKCLSAWRKALPSRGHVPVVRRPRRHHRLAR